MAIFEYKYKVGINYVNDKAVITNPGMLSILEDVACKHSDTVNFGIKDIPIIQLSWVLLAWKIKILKRVSYGTVLTARTWARPSQKFYTYRDFEVLDESGEVVCIATSKWALINLAKSSIEKITDDIFLRYNPEDRAVFEEADIEKLSEPLLTTPTYFYTTQRRDIDINKHMNNINYLYLAYETLPFEIYTAEECNNIIITYKKGMKLGDTAKCFYNFSENAHFVTIKSEDDSHLHALIKLW